MVQMRVGRVAVARAVTTDRRNVQAIFKNHSDVEGVKKEITRYYKSPATHIIWRDALKKIWFNAGKASIDLYHSFFTGKSLEEIEGVEEDEWAPLPAFDFYEVVRKELTDVNDTWARAVDNYLRNGGAGDVRITGITDTTNDKIMNTIAEGVAKGEDTERLGKRVEEHLDETWPSRGETIARTEVSAAVNSASLEDARATVPGMNKVWICSFVNSRYWHEDADGQSVPQDQPFVVGPDGEEEELDHPGDPEGSGYNVINCMCSIGYEPPEEAVPAGETEEEAAAAAAEFGDETPQLTDEQTTELANLFDQVAAGEGQLTHDEAAAVSSQIDEIMAPAEAPAAEGGEAAAAATDADSYAAFVDALGDALYTGLSDSEKAAVEHYSDYGYARWNYLLNRGEELNAEEQAGVNALEGVLEKAPKYDGISYRGLHVHPDDAFFKDISTWNVGDTQTFRGFTSTDVYESNASRFISPIRDQSYMLELEGKQGAIFKPFSAAEATESEVLFKTNASYEITSYERAAADKPYYWLIRLKEVV